MPDANSRYIKEIITSHEKERRNIEWTKGSIIKWNTINFKVIKRFNCIKVCDKKWIEVNYLSGGQYSAIKNIRFKTPMLRSDFCDYSDVHIVVKRTRTATGTANTNKRNKKLNFNNVSPLQDNAEDCDITMPIYNLVEYSNKYSMTSGKLWNY